MYPEPHITCRGCSKARKCQRIMPTEAPGPACKTPVTVYPRSVPRQHGVGLRERACLPDSGGAFGFPMAWIRVRRHALAALGARRSLTPPPGRPACQVCKVDVAKPAWEQPTPVHNRWHPDIPPVATVKEDQLFRVETIDWTGAPD